VDIRRLNLLSIILSQEIPAHPACNRPVANVTTLRKLGFVVTKMAGRNPDWTRDELILALDVRFKSAPERRARTVTKVPSHRYDGRSPALTARAAGVTARIDIAPDGTIQSNRSPPRRKGN
jgi:hypothetical protein